MCSCFQSSPRFYIHVNKCTTPMCLIYSRLYVIGLAANFYSNCHNIRLLSIDHGTYTTSYIILSLTSLYMMTPYIYLTPAGLIWNHFYRDRREQTSQTYSALSWTSLTDQIIQYKDSGNMSLWGSMARVSEWVGLGCLLFSSPEGVCSHPGGHFYSSCASLIYKVHLKSEKFTNIMLVLFTRMYLPSPLV